MKSLTLPELYTELSKVEIELKWIDIDIQRLEKQRKGPARRQEQLKAQIAKLDQKNWVEQV